jgi:hypothetical protein
VVDDRDALADHVVLGLAEARDRVDTDEGEGGARRHVVHHLGDGRAVLEVLEAAGLAEVRSRHVRGQLAVVLLRLPVAEADVDDRHAYARAPGAVREPAVGSGACDRLVEHGGGVRTGLLLDRADCARAGEPAQAAGRDGRVEQVVVAGDDGAARGADRRGRCGRVARAHLDLDARAA